MSPENSSLGSPGSQSPGLPVRDSDRGQVRGLILRYLPGSDFEGADRAARAICQLMTVDRSIARREGIAAGEDRERRRAAQAPRPVTPQPAPTPKKRPAAQTKTTKKPALPGLFGG